MGASPSRPSRVRTSGPLSAGGSPPARPSASPSLPMPPTIPPSITVPAPAAGAAGSGGATTSTRIPLLLSRYEGVIETDVVERPIEGRSHWIDWLPALSVVVFILASLPTLIRAFMPLVMLLVVLLVIPMLLFRSAGGLIFGILGLLLPRGRRAPRTSSELSFRLRTTDGRRQDVVLKGPRSGLQLGDDVDVTALRGRTPLQAVVVRNRTSPGRYVRQGLVGAVVASAFLVLAVVSLLAGLVAR